MPEDNGNCFKCDTKIKAGWEWNYHYFYCPMCKEDRNQDGSSTKPFPSIQEGSQIPKYIPSLMTNLDVQEKLTYLEKHQDFNPINAGWVLKNFSKLAHLIAESKCAECDNKNGQNWFSVEDKVLCKPCFEKYRDAL